MAYSFDLATNKTIEFDDFVEHVHKEVNNKEPLSLLNCTDVLQRLSNNNTFLSDYINKELKDLSLFQNENVHSVQSLMLYRTDTFYVRINVWPPLSTNPSISSWQTELYQYLKAHDHNFWFLTSGYFGKGYDTEIWEYDNDSVVGFVGEKVKMEFLEKTKLTKGKVMLYRASKDIHTQFAPEDFSISINIMLNTNELLEKEQFYFDTNKRVILKNTNTSLSTRYMIIELAKLFGNSKTINYLTQISENHQLPHIRIKSLQSLATLINDAERIWKKALNDPHQSVVNSAKMHLEKL